MAWLRVQYYSETLGMPVPMDVLIPQSSSSNLQTYATLYLLHDMGEGHTSWIRKTSLERYAEDLSLAIVMPAGHRGYYTDMCYGKRYFSFITEELPVICERMFPLSQAKEDRFIAGNRIGGYGALKAGLSATNMFSIAASFSGPIDVADIVEQMDGDEAMNVFGAKSELKGSSNDLYAVADSMRSSHDLPEIYLSCDTEDFFLKQNESFVHYVSSIGIPPTFEKFKSGDAGWKHWDCAMEKFLTWLSVHKPRIKKKGDGPWLG